MVCIKNRKGDGNIRPYKLTSEAKSWQVIVSPVKEIIECIFIRYFTGDILPRIHTKDPIPRITCLQKL